MLTGIVKDVFVPHSDVETFVADVNAVLNTPCKRKLWLFLLPRMPEHQRAYVTAHSIDAANQPESR